MPNYSEWAINLPNQFPPLGEVMQHGIDMQGKRNAQLLELQRQKLKDQRDETNANLEELKRQTGEVEKTKTLSEGINATTHGEINNVYKEYSQLAKKMSPADYLPALANRLNQISQWHQAAVAGGENMMKERDEILKKNPELDASKLFDTGATNFANKFINPSTGQLIPPERINPHQGFFENLQNPEEMAAHTATTEGIPKYFKDMERTPFAPKNETNKKGFIQKHNFKATNLGDIQQLEHDAEGNPIENPLKYEKSDIADANGNKLRMITPTLEQGMRANGLGNQMDRLWQLNREKEVVDWAVKNRKRPDEITPEIKEQLRKSFLYKNFSQYIPSQVSPEDLVATPKDRAVSINFGMQQRNQAEEVIDNLTSAIKNKDASALKQYASYFNRGNTKNKLQEAFFLPDGKAVLQYQVVDEKGHKKLKEQYLNSDDPYLRDKVIGTYQDFMGSSVPTETLPIGGNLPNVSPVMQSQKPVQQSSHTSSKYHKGSLD